LKEYIETKKKTGIGAVTLKDGDELAAVTLIKDEPVIIMTNQGYVIKFDSTEVAQTSRMTSGVKGIGLNEGDYVIAALPVRNTTDDLAIISTTGTGKRVKQSEIVAQKRGGKGMNYFKASAVNGNVAGGQLVNDEDSILIVGNQSSICISAKDIPVASRIAIGNILSKCGKVLSVSKV
jgi:DNA gyrase/topoisomerase IV subunit A